MTATNVRPALLLAASIILGIAVLAGARTAHADVSCYHWDTARAQLQAKYGEVPTQRSLDSGIHNRLANHYGRFAVHKMGLEPMA